MVLKRVERKFEIHKVYDVTVGNTLKNVLEELGGIMTVNLNEKQSLLEVLVHLILEVIKYDEDKCLFSGAGHSKFFKYRLVNKR